MLVCCGTVSAELGFLPGDASELESAWSSGLRDLQIDRATTKIIRDKQPNPPRLQKYQRASMEVHVRGRPFNTAKRRSLQLRTLSCRGVNLMGGVSQHSA